MVRNSLLQAVEPVDLLRIVAQFTWRCGRDLRVDSVEMLDARCSDDVLRILRGARLDRLAERSLYPAERRGLSEILACPRDFSDVLLTLSESEGHADHLVLSGRALRSPDDTFAGFVGFGRMGKDRPFDALQRQELVAQLERTEAARAREQELRFESEALLESLRALHEPVPLAEKCRGILNAFAPLLKFEEAMVVRRGMNGALVIVASTLAGDERLVWPEGPLVAAALAGQASVHADLAGQEEARSLAPPLARYGRAALFAPLSIGREHAVLIALHSHPSMFDKSHLGIMERLSLVAAQAFESDDSRNAIINASKLATLGEMLAAIAHEVNQPLSVISMAVQNAQYLVEAKAPASEILEKLRRTDSQARRAGDIVKAIRSLAHPNRTSTLAEPLALESVIRSLALLCEGTLRAKGIAFEIGNLEECQEVLADPGGLEQVLLNLVVNARDAVTAQMERKNSRSGGRISIHVVDNPESHRLLIRVSDNGGGIPEDVIERIFDPFFTLKDVGKGTGLGLAICRNLLADMQGSMSVHNDVDGAVFEIELRAAPPRSDGAIGRESDCYIGHTEQ